MAAAISLINELEDALGSSSSEKRLATLRRITDLFLNEADRLNDQQIAVFDDVLVHLAQRIEQKARIELSTILAPLPNAPIEVVRHLANDDEITVAHPVLSQSSRLTESDLVDIAKCKSQEHLLAISGRPSLGEALTDVLVERGDYNVVLKLAGNSGARFSEPAYAAIAENAAHDGPLAETFASRVDLSLPMLRQLLSRATDMVVSRLLTFASLKQRDQIQQALMDISNEVAREACKPRDFSASERLVQQVHRRGALDEKTLAEFAAHINTKKRPRCLRHYVVRRLSSLNASCETLMRWRGCRRRPPTPSRPARPSARRAHRAGWCRPGRPAPADDR